MFVFTLNTCSVVTEQSVAILALTVVPSSSVDTFVVTPSLVKSTLVHICNEIVDYEFCAIVYTI